MNKFAVALKSAEIAFALSLTFSPACCVALAQDSSNPPGEKPSEEDSKIAYGAESDFTSGSAWRGLVISDRPVVSNAGWISKYGFTFIAANTLALSNTTEGTRPRVTDLILTYEQDWGKLKIEPTFDTYWYRDPLNIATSRSMEGSIKLSYPAGPIRLFTSHSFDVLTHKGAYFGEAGIELARRLSEKNELGISNLSMPFTNSWPHRWPLNHSKVLRFSRGISVCSARILAGAATSTRQDSSSGTSPRLAIGLS